MTTPGPGELAEWMARSVGRGVRSWVLEVSSHGLTQERVAGIPFAGGALVNLSRDHLDYHGSFRAYRDAKLRLLEHLAPDAPCVLPAKEPFLDDLPSWPGPLLRHSIDPRGLAGSAGGTVLSERRLDQSGIEVEVEILGERATLRSPLHGRHNLENILVAATLARAIGIPLEAIAAGVESTNAVRGRLEEVPRRDGGRVFIDYAHTPDALSAVLGSVREWRAGRLLVVFGCGGDRDRGKRPEMGAAAARHADRLFVTSDNPRSEDPRAIIDDVLTGIPDRSRVVIEPDRRAAIAAALADLGRDDCLVVAGKGHETEQVVGDERRPFDDRSVVAELLAEGGAR